MSFYKQYQKLKDIDVSRYISQVTNQDIERILAKDNLNWQDFLALLAPEASNHLEKLAQKAHQKTVQHFGYTMKLYTPLYLSNYCVNQCAYCGFNAQNDLKRQKLSLEEIKHEAEALQEKGLKHLLILTGESRAQSPISYIKEAVSILKNYFSSLAIEIYPLEVKEYEELIQAGVDGLTIYQEVYQEEFYNQVHLSGPKTNYKYRIETPERGCKAGMRWVNIGPLFGLANWKKEAFLAAMHAQYLQDQFLDTKISLSIPRLKSHLGEYSANSLVTDKNLVQLILAFRLFLPRLGITLSTREDDQLRDNLIPLGVTKLSAESSTVVGGYATNQGTSQFDTSDKRTVEEIKRLLRTKGYQPIVKDWQSLVRS